MFPVSFNLTGNKRLQGRPQDPNFKMKLAAKDTVSLLPNRLKKLQIDKILSTRSPLTFYKMKWCPAPVEKKFYIADVHECMENVVISSIFSFPIFRMSKLIF